MPPFDREAALKSAEKSLRLGRIDAAIAEYLRIVEAQPRDWNSANALGDLYVRAGQVDKGLEQYGRIADHLGAEGFYPKAAALYKKILKIRPGEESALLKSGEIAAKQGLLADAKSALRAVAEKRRGRGDAKGAAELTIRIGGLDANDLEARLASARAATEIGDTRLALTEFRELARRFEEHGDTKASFDSLKAATALEPGNQEVRRQLLDGYLRAKELAQARALAATSEELRLVASAYRNAGHDGEALEVLAQVAALEPGDVSIRAELARAFVARGELDGARLYLDSQTAAEDAGLWLALSEIELTAGRIGEGRAAVTEALRLDPALRDAAVALACRLAGKSPEAGYACVDVVAEIALAKRDFATAAAAVQEFARHVHHHVVALMRLVEICVDGGLESSMHEAQAQLADAYLEVGRGLEARIISEDLVAREPWVTAHIDRFRRALEMLGETDPDTIIAERLSGDSPFLATDKLDLNEGVFFEDEIPAEEEPVVEAASETRTPPSDPDEAAAEQLRLGITYRELGMSEDAREAFEKASASSRVRFEAAAALGAMYLEIEELDLALEWYGNAAGAAAPNPEAGHSLLYDYALALERAGDPERALAVLKELEAESHGYRDVTQRIARLSKVKVKG